MITSHYSSHLTLPLPTPLLLPVNQVALSSWILMTFLLLPQIVTGDTQTRSGVILTSSSCDIERGAKLPSVQQSSARPLSPRDHEVKTRMMARLAMARSIIGSQAYFLSPKSQSRAFVSSRMRKGFDRQSCPLCFMPLCVLPICFDNKVLVYFQFLL